MAGDGREEVTSRVCSHLRRAVGVSVDEMAAVLGVEHGTVERYEGGRAQVRGLARYFYECLRRAVARVGPAEAWGHPRLSRPHRLLHILAVGSASDPPTCLAPVPKELAS